MAFLTGIDVVLHVKTSTGRDAFNREIFEETTEIIRNVLVAPIGTVSQSGEAIINELSLNGKKAVYQLGIPKDDTHNWEDAIVEFFGEKWKSIGYSVLGMDHMMPLPWNRKVIVERYG